MNELEREAGCPLRWFRLVNEVWIIVIPLGRGRL
jgi:hypothetical protein